MLSANTILELISEEADSTGSETSGINQHTWHYAEDS